jgi:hypothetical protein
MMSFHYNIDTYIKGYHCQLTAIAGPELPISLKVSDEKIFEIGIFHIIQRTNQSKL